VNIFPIAWVRSQFPSLGRTVNDCPIIYLDGPGGTQVPAQVIAAVSDYYQTSNSNLGGRFATSEQTGAIVSDAREMLARFLGAKRPEEIVFGQNMTSLTFALSRALAQSWEPGAEIIVTSLDHDANVTTWRRAASERGVEVRTWDFRPETCTLELSDLKPLVNRRTVLIAVTLASNAVGSMVDVAAVTRLAHTVGAKVFVDGVHSAPHAAINVQLLDCDFLGCSAYKFFGPHVGVLWGRHDLLASIQPYKVRPAANEPPGSWETGTQSFESIAGAAAAVRYLESINAHSTGISDLKASMDSITAYERQLAERFLAGITEIPGLQLFGLNSAQNRTPTFAIRLAQLTPEEIADRLGRHGIFVWHGHFYAVDVINRLGLADRGGVVRLGFAHYNTLEEVDRALALLAEIATD
jgi:cysteine desulfurase family protein (TIGR01976 family)